MFCNGVDVDVWGGKVKGSRIPTYAFDRQRYWLQGGDIAPAEGNGLLGASIGIASLIQTHFLNHFWPLFDPLFWPFQCIFTLSSAITWGSVGPFWPFFRFFWDFLAFFEAPPWPFFGPRKIVFFWQFWVKTVPEIAGSARVGESARRPYPPGGGRRPWVSATIPKTGGVRSPKIFGQKKNKKRT